MAHKRWNLFQNGMCCSSSVSYQNILSQPLDEATAVWTTEATRSSLAAGVRDGQEAPLLYRYTEGVKEH